MPQLQDDRIDPDTLPDNPTTKELLHFAVAVSREALRTSREALALATETRDAVRTVADTQLETSQAIVRLHEALAGVQCGLVDTVRFDRDALVRASAPRRPVVSWGPPAAAVTKVRAWAALGVLALAGATGVALAEWLAGR